MAGSRHIDVTGLINGNGPGAVSAVSRSVVGGNPLFVSRGVVLDGHVIVIRFSAQYASCHIDIARVINLNGNGRVVSGSAVALNPLFLSSRIVFDGRVIIIRKCCAETKSSYINIALLINGNSCRCVIAISKAVEAGDHASCMAPDGAGRPLPELYARSRTKGCVLGLARSVVRTPVTRTTKPSRTR